MTNIVKFVKTCSACPEQYDVYDLDGDVMGYVRLRHGFLSYDGPGSFTRNFNELIPTEEMEPEELTLGDLANDHGSDGVFADFRVRDAYLTMIARHISCGQTDEYEVDNTSYLL